MGHIYKIINKLNDECYIGSSIDVKKRWNRHKRDLFKGKHHSIILQRAWDKYGENNFEFIILEETEKLIDRENYYLLLLEPVYNICRSAYSTTGREYKEETRVKHKKFALENNIRPPKETYEQKYKAVIKVDKITNIDIEEYKCLSDACFAIGKNYTFVSTISSVCRGKRKSAFGFKWRFKDA